MLSAFVKQSHSQARTCQAAKGEIRGRWRAHSGQGGRLEGRGEWAQSHAHSPSSSLTPSPAKVCLCSESLPQSRGGRRGLRRPCPFITKVLALGGMRSELAAISEPQCSSASAPPTRLAAWLPSSSSVHHPTLLHACSIWGPLWEHSWEHGGPRKTSGRMVLLPEPSAGFQNHSPSLNFF